jgi:hypothetical protein
MDLLREPYRFRRSGDWQEEAAMRHCRNVAALWLAGFASRAREDRELHRHAWDRAKHDGFMRCDEKRRPAYFKFPQKR